MRIGYLALVKNLQENIHNVRVSFFDFVKQNNRIRLSADALGELSRLVISHISGRRSDYFSNTVLLHIFRHIKTDKRIDRIKHLFRQNFDKLGFSYACGSHKDK